jgi:glutamate/tyrosine decarboxylase-like PLP-dependent enzyme
MSSHLQLDPQTMRALGHRVIDDLVDRLEALPSAPLEPPRSRAELERALRGSPPRAGRAAAEVLEWLQREVLARSIPLDHPRFFAFVSSPSNFISVLADTLTAGYNVFTGTWLAGSGPTMLEIVTVEWLRDTCGLPATGGGMFTSGGSAAAMTALAVMRREACEGRRERAVVYCSDQTHASIDRALWLLGFRREQLRRIASDDAFRMPMAYLRRTVDADRRAGLEPACVVANAGTTNTGAVDPLAETADFCARERLWLHVDGAYGAAAMLTASGPSLMDGLGRADSLVLDPHKWLFQPFEIGCVLLRDANLLRRTFHEQEPEYLQDTVTAAGDWQGEVNLHEFGPQLTRSARALKLWATLQVFGIDALRAAVTRGVELAAYAEALLRRDARWQVLSPASLGIVTFRLAPPGVPAQDLDELNQRIGRSLLDDGFAFVTSTRLKGRTALRLCTINPRTSESDIDQTITRLGAASVSSVRRPV